MSQIVDSPKKTLVCGSAIGVGVLVKIASNKAEIAGLADEPIGVLDEEAFADGDVRTITLLNKGGTIKCKAAGGFTQGAVVFGRALGLVDDVATSSAVRIGIAMETAGAANDLVEVLPDR